MVGVVVAVVIVVVAVVAAAVVAAIAYGQELWADVIESSRNRPLTVITVLLQLIVSRCLKNSEIALRSSASGHS